MGLAERIELLEEKVIFEREGEDFRDKREVWNSRAVNEPSYS